MTDMWKFDNAAYERLESMMSVVSPSMDETDMAQLLRKSWSECGVDVDTDVLGNIHTCIKGERDMHVALCAHMDSVAVQITRILPNGMLQFRRIGLTPHVLLGQKLLIKTDKGYVTGVVGFDPTSQYGQPKGLVEEDLWIDICVRSQAEADELVSVGDLAVISGGISLLNKDFLCGSFLDDRIGLFVISECLRWFAERGTYLNVHFIASVQEEVGLRGSSVIASGHAYDACFVVDVDYATDTLTPHENQMGALSLGKGVGFHHKADNSPVLRRLAVRMASDSQIPYQISLGRFPYGGTDSSPVQVSGRGVATLNVSVPCRYMHSPVEVCHKADVEAAVNILIETVDLIGIRLSNTFIPGID